MIKNISLFAKKGDRGFALISAVTLMVLLALISVGLLSLSMSTVRVTSASRDMEEARAQARLALEIAMGQLQCALGPDQRISASSGMFNGETDGSVPAGERVSLGNGSAHILGVWDSWDTWLNRTNSEGKSITSTYGNGRSSHFRRWLISSPDDKELTEWGSVKSKSGLGSDSGDNYKKIVLLGEGSMGNSHEEDYVYASLVEVDTSTAGSAKTGARNAASRRSHIAWWVSGENLKARINLATYKPSSSSGIEILRRSWDTPAPDASVIPGMRQYADELQDTSAQGKKNKEKIITRDTLTLLGQGGRRNSKVGTFHNVSLTSSGLITDVRWGGLKRDLSTLLSSASFVNSDYYETSGADVGIRPYSAVDGNNGISNDKRPLASWKQLYYWYNMWSGQTLNGQDSTAPLKWSGNRPYTYIAADSLSEKQSSNEPSVMNNRFTYMRQPVLLKMYVFAAFVLVFHDTYAPFDGLDGETGARPVFVWWNPYNVQMDVGENDMYMGGFGGAYRTYPLQVSFKSDSGRWDDSGNGRTFKFPWLKYTENQFSTYNVSYSRGLTDQGNSFRKDYKEKRIVFEPGEIKVFTQDLQYDKANNSENVFKRSSSETALEFDNVADANHYVHRFEGHEITYEQRNEYAPTNTIPVLFKYTTGFSKPSEDPTPGNHICLGWMWRTDIVDTYLNYRLPSGMSALLKPSYGRQAIYQLFLKNNDSDDLINFAVGAGLMNENYGNLTLGELEEGKSIRHYFPSFMNINWIEEKPYSLIKGEDGIRIREPLFNVMWNGDGMPARKGGTWGEPNNDGNPFWISYYGISPKTSTGPSDVNARYKGEDVRNKSWQYSPPFFWGSQMINPSELLRRHHPYQFELRQRESNDYTQLDIISGDVVGQVIANSETGSGDENGRCYFGYRDEDMVNRIVATELPIHPPFSLAGFAGARLTPGWYDESRVLGDGELMAKRALRISYQSGVPGVGIGNSMADPMIPFTKVHFNYTEQDKELADFWDHALMVNDVLWDSWFTSSLSDRPRSLGDTKVSRQDVVSDFVDNFYSDSDNESKALSNSRFKLNPGTSSESEVSRNLIDDSIGALRNPAKYLTVEGAFNVNCTSVEAWTAVLNGLKNRGILYADKTTGEPKVLTESINSDSKVFLKRFAVASSSETRYGKPLLRVDLGQDEYSWSDLRELSAASSADDNSDISNLAKMIVAQVRKRGPFLNMSEFINRSFDSSDKSANNSVLNNAINMAGLNDEFETAALTLEAYENYNNPEASAGSLQTASPGYLLASDLLSSLGNTLTVRDDTFTIRAYGQVTDPAGTKIRGRAWCEAVVQRCIDYVDSENDPELPAYEVNLTNGDLTRTRLSQINKAFGRKFKILSFRWLAPEEV